MANTLWFRDPAINDWSPITGLTIAGMTGGATGAHVVNGVFAKATSATISCTDGNLLVVFCVQRYAMSTPAGWTLLHTDAGIQSAQWCYTLYKTAGSASETFQANTQTPNRTYISIFEIAGAGTPQYVNETSLNPYATVTRTNDGLTLWGAHQYSFPTNTDIAWVAKKEASSGNIFDVSVLQGFGSANDNPNRAASFADESGTSIPWTVSYLPSTVSYNGRMTQIYIPDAA